MVQKIQSNCQWDEFADFRIISGNQDPFGKWRTIGLAWHLDFEDNRASKISEILKSSTTTSLSGSVC